MVVRTDQQSRLIMISYREARATSTIWLLPIPPMTWTDKTGMVAFTALGPGRVTFPLASLARNKGAAALLAL